MNTGNRPGPFALPDLQNTFPGPFPANAHAGTVEEHLRRWIAERNLPVPPAGLQTLCGITAQGIARAFPAADLGALLPAGELFVWLVAFDDAHGETSAAADPTALADRAAELTQALAGEVPVHPESPFTTALRGVLARFRDRATPAQYLRLTGHLRDNLLGLLWEAHHLTAPGRVPLPVYCAMRPLTVFVRTLMAIAPITLSYELSARHHSLDPVRRMETAVAHLAGWVNDLASYQRESRAGAAPLSLPTLLMAERRLTLPEAFETAARMCEEQAATARGLIDGLSAGGPSPLTRHAQAMRHLVHAFIWHIRHDRYVPAPAVPQA
ncbi:terpene synthase family protein [Streptomyces sp. NPDC058861]|uniref:terpene synthase family protein n=1 Tax=Streptomyces sp. NPDC058861 TaxID=3346653 RepID=UPI0036AE0FAD